MNRATKLILTCVLVFFISSIGLNADITDLSLNFGIVTDDSFSFKPFLWTAGLNYNFHINELVSLSPECHIIVHQFDFEYFILAPSVMVNFNFDSFFAGAGLTKWFLIGEGSDFSTDVGLKLHLGFGGNNLRLTFYLVTAFDNLFAKGMAVGTTLGFGF